MNIRPTYVLNLDYAIHLQLFKHINSILRPFLENFVILYLDDILIYSKDLEEHHNHVRQVLQKLLENNLYVKLPKWEFVKIGDRNLF